MSEVISKNKLWIFYVGIFLSQLGSFTFILGLIYFPPLNNWSSLEVGLLLASSHLFSTLSLMFFGDLGDRVSPKKLIFSAELAAVAISVFSIYCWQNNSTNSRYLFILAVGLRSIVTAIQAPARNKYLKLASNSKERTKLLSIFLTAISQGTIFFSAILSWFYFKDKTFIATIVFDLLSFLVNGIIILTLPDLTIEKTSKISLKNRLMEYIAIDKNLALKDFLAMVCISGVSLLIIRISSSFSHLSIVLGGMFGLSFLVSGFIFSKVKTENFDYFIWPLYTISFFLLYFAKSFETIILFMGLLFVFYALLMHNYIARWQHESPVHSIANIFSIRTILLSLTLGFGELMFGKLAPFLSVNHEVLIRGFIAMLITVFVLKNRINYESK